MISRSKKECAGGATSGIIRLSQCHKSKVRAKITHWQQKKISSASRTMTTALKSSTAAAFPFDYRALHHILPQSPLRREKELVRHKKNPKPIDGWGPYAKHLTSKSVEASDDYEQVKALIALPFVGVDFCCNVALGTGGGTSS
jgi:hypothetical protein